MSYGLVLTTAGAAAIEAAYQAGKTVTIASVALGDGGGAALPTTPGDMAGKTQLAGQFGAEVFSAADRDEGMISGKTVIPCASYPGKILREVGLMSDSGTLIAYGIYPDTYLPAQTDSVIKEIILTLVLALTHAESVTLLVDPNTAILTQDAGDARYLKQDSNLADVNSTEDARKNIGLGNVGNYKAVQANGGKHSNGDHDFYLDWGTDKKLYVTVDATDVGELFTTQNPPTASQTGAYPMSGGLLDNGADVSIITGEQIAQDGKYLYSQMFRTCLRGRGGNMDFLDGASFFMRLIEHVGTLAYGEIVFDGFGSVHSFRFTQNGDLQIDGGFYAASAQFAPNGNAYGSIWGGWLSDWLNNNISGLTSQISEVGSLANDAWNKANDALNKANDAWNKANDAQLNRIQGVQLGAAQDIKNGSGSLADQPGHVVTMGGDFGADDGYYRLRPLQYLINGQWVTVASA